MEVYTKQLVRSNSHNVESRESNSTSCRSINSGEFGSCQQRNSHYQIIYSFVPVLSPDSPTTTQWRPDSRLQRYHSSYLQWGSKGIVVLSRIFFLHEPCNSIGLAILTFAGLQYGILVRMVTIYFYPEI